MAIIAGNFDLAEIIKIHKTSDVGKTYFDLLYLTRSSCTMRYKSGSYSYWIDCADKKPFKTFGPSFSNAVCMKIEMGHLLSISNIKTQTCDYLIRSVLAPLSYFLTQSYSCLQLRVLCLWYLFNLISMSRCHFSQWIGLNLQKLAVLHLYCLYYIRHLIQPRC